MNTQSCSIPVHSQLVEKMPLIPVTLRQEGKSCPFGEKFGRPSGPSWCNSRRFFWHPRRKSVGWFRYERVWIYTFNVNPGLINHGLLIRGTPPIVIIWYLNGTPPIKQPRGLLIQGWHYICFLGIFWSSSWYHSEKQPESWSKWLRKCNDLASRQGLLVGSWTWPNEGSALASRVGTSWVGTVQSSWHVLSSSWNLLDDGNHFLAPSSQNITAIGP